MQGLHVNSDQPPASPHDPTGNDRQSEPLLLRRRSDRAFETFDGSKVIKLRSLAGLGQAVGPTMVRQIGLGGLLLSAETADQAISRLGDTVQRLLTQGPPCDPKQIVALIRLQKEFNAQLITIGAAQLRAAGETSTDPTGTGNNMQIPFPAGAPIAPPLRHQP